MNVEFFWIEDHSRKEPYLKTNIKNDKGFDLLAFLLSDDGGMGYKLSIEDIDDGLRGVNLIKEGALKKFDWARHSWGAVLEIKEVKVYSLYDEDYFIIMSFNDFEKILKEWRKFILDG